MIAKLNWPYFEKLFPIDLCKQQKLDADRKAIQKISLTVNLDPYGNTKIFSFI